MQARSQNERPQPGRRRRTVKEHGPDPADVHVGSRLRLARGEQAQHWMDGEVKKINEFLQQLPGPNGPTAADGGMFSAGLARYIEREQMLALFHEFFSPYASRK